MVQRFHTVALLITLSSLFVLNVNALATLLQGPQPYCFNLFIEKKNDLRVSYLISGANEDQVDFTVKYPDGREIYSASKRSQNEVTIQALDRTSLVYLCWQKTDRRPKKLTFNFQVERDAMNKIAGNEIADIMNKRLSKITEHLDKISRNIYMTLDVHKSYTDLIFTSAGSQTWYSILKMLLVIGVCIGQVFFITDFFKSNSGKPKSGGYGQTDSGMFKQSFI